MNKPPKYYKSLETRFTGTELLTIKDMWVRCRWIDVELLRPQGVQKPISFKSDRK